MLYVTRKSLLFKALPFVSLLVASSLLAQVVEIGNRCSEYCHAVGTNVYNDWKREGAGERQALSGGADAMESCLNELSTHEMCS